ncbi:MAG: DUF3054 family protein, partial [Gaiella sp.]
GLARDWLPLAIGYAAAALALHAWTRPGIVTFLQAWLLGITTGVVIRGVALDREPGAEQLQFLAVTLVVTLALLGAWRAIERVVRRRAHPAG